MRQGPNSRRTRGRSSNAGRRANLPNRNQTFDSNGPEERIRGSAYQVYEKYLALARDASVSGDRVKSENYFQHAEHYFRIINAMNEAYAQAERQPSERQPSDRQPADRQYDGARGGGQREYARENGRGDSEGQQEREAEFGEDPRGLEDSSNEPLSLDRPSNEPDIAHAAGRESEGEGEGGEGGESGDWQRPIRPRRRAPRPRRPSGGNGSSEAAESPTEGGGD